MAENPTKKMLADQFLRAKPKFNSDLVALAGEPLQVFAGEKVKTGAKDPVAETVNDTQITWTFVEAVSGDDVDQRKGFVSGGALVDEGADVAQSGGFQPFPASVSKAEFADACYVQAELQSTNPAYLFALAFVQSGNQWGADEVKTADAADAPAVGVYQFTGDTWAALLQLADTSDLTLDRIKFPTAQCVVAAVLASKAATLLKGLITDRGVSAVDLYLAHMFAEEKSFGSNAAAKLLDAEKADPAQPCMKVITEIYTNGAVRTAFLKRNSAIFKEDGSATIEQALKTCTDKFVAGFDEVRRLANKIKESIPPDVGGPALNIQFSGRVIAISDQDVDALARVGESEVGNFGVQFGDGELTRALGGVIDTVINRAVHPSTQFPKTIQAVINQRSQFSAINDIGTWERLPKAPQKVFDMVQGHVQGRARGTASEIKGATHFFNPDTSNPPWGGPIRAHPTATFGKPKNSHIHGFPKDMHAPEGYAIQVGKDAAVFSGDGQPQGGLISLDKSVESILAAANKEWNFWGNSTFAHIGHTDREIEFATYVRDTYCKPLSASPPLSDIQNNKYAWSAVTISYMLRRAGLSSAEFTFSQRHSTYIREAIKARADQDTRKGYWGFRIGDPEAVLAPGDIVGYGRTHGMTFAQAQALFDRQDDYESHSDIVVAVKAGAADVIGGNVSNSVTKKTLKLDGRGKLADRGSLAFVVMKKK
jgi:spore germination cell wall hydrolase CwlJ-like protein